MAVQLFQDSLNLTVDQVQPVPSDPSGPLPACYPLPELRLTGTKLEQEATVVVLQNDCLEVSLSPGLGGRVVGIKDRRTGLNVLPPLGGLEIGGDRGVWMPGGLRILVGQPGLRDRLNSMAPVDVQLIEPSEESPGAILIHDLAPGTPISWQAAWSLDHESGEILFEISVFNRALAVTAVEIGLAIPIRGGKVVEAPGGAAILGENDIAWWIQESLPLLLESGSGDVVVRPGFAVSPLLPRETLSWRVRLCPYSGLGKPRGASMLAAAGVEGGRMQVQSSRPVAGADVVLVTSDGGFSAGRDLLPAAPMVVDLSALPKVLQIQVGEEAISLEPVDRKEDCVIPSAVRSALASVPAESIEARFLASQGPVPPLPGIDHARRLSAALKWAQQENWKEADRELEQALLTNGEDVLGWWMKAWFKRLGGEVEDRPELLNAHFLSPMEPCLRAEAFLQAGRLQGREGNPVSRRLAENPDAALETVHWLLEAGQDGEAEFLLDELLRHRSVGLWRILLAWILGVKRGIVLEAGVHAAALEKLPLEAPYPWRTHELKACTEVARLFPRSERVNQYGKLAELRLYSGS